MKAHTYPAHRFSGQFANFEDLEQKPKQQQGAAVASSSSATVGSDETNSSAGLLSRRRSTHESREKIMQKSLLGANSSHTSSSAVTDVNIFSAVLNPVTLFFHSDALERKYVSTYAGAAAGQPQVSHFCISFQRMFCDVLQNHFHVSLLSYLVS